MHLIFRQIDLQAHNLAHIQDISGSLTGLLLHDTIENEVCEKSLCHLFGKNNFKKYISIKIYFHKLICMNKIYRTQCTLHQVELKILKVHHLTYR